MWTFYHNIVTVSSPDPSSLFVAIAVVLGTIIYACSMKEVSR